MGAARRPQPYQSNFRMRLSVIICTHNPRENALRRTLDSLRGQSLPMDQWELILVDNASESDLASKWDLDWHPHGRVVREEELGLTPARLRGIAESSAEILCFVDDDNELDGGYLESALKVAHEYPVLGCWGGEILGEYEVPPPAWFKGYENMLAVRPLPRDTWGNAYRFGNGLPCGAGMCVRRPVVEEYLRQCENSPLRKSLDRRGNSTASNGDVDLAYTALDMGMGTGRFKSMRMTHLIPAGRLEPDYLERLAEGMTESNVYLDFCRKETRPSRPVPESQKRTFWYWMKWLRAGHYERRMMEARRRGLNKALLWLSKNPR